LRSAEMHYHWGSSQTIQTKGAWSRASPRHQHLLRGDIAPACRPRSSSSRLRAARQTTVRKS